LNNFFLLNTLWLSCDSGSGKLQAFVGSYAKSQTKILGSCVLKILPKRKKRTLCCWSSKSRTMFGLWSVKSLVNWVRTEVENTFCWRQGNGCYKFPTVDQGEQLLTLCCGLSLVTIFLWTKCFCCYVTSSFILFHYYLRVQQSIIQFHGHGSPNTRFQFSNFVISSEIVLFYLVRKISLVTCVIVQVISMFWPMSIGSNLNYD